MIEVLAFIFLAILAFFAPRTVLVAVVGVLLGWPVVLIVALALVGFIIDCAAASDN